MVADMAVGTAAVVVDKAMVVCTVAAVVADMAVAADKAMAASTVVAVVADRYPAAGQHP